MRELEFKNIECSDECIAADLYLEGRFIVRLSVKNLAHLMNSTDTNIGLYEFFRTAMITCVAVNGLHNGSSTIMH
jgi:hypothetical protein